MLIFQDGGEAAQIRRSFRIELSDIVCDPLLHTARLDCKLSDCLSAILNPLDRITLSSMSDG